MSAMHSSIEQFRAGMLHGPCLHKPGTAARCADSVCTICISIFRNPEHGIDMALLRPQDLLVSLKLTLEPKGKPRPYSALAHDLAMSPSKVHDAVKRATAAGLLLVDRKPHKRALLEFILHGVRYAFYTKLGPVTLGMPTAHAAPPLVEAIAASELPPVWPDPEGTHRGEAVEPLHASVPRAARNDPGLYELLALVDALRIGRARERRLAAEHLERRLKA